MASESSGESNLSIMCAIMDNYSIFYKDNQHSNRPAIIYPKQRKKPQFSMKPGSSVYLLSTCLPSSLRNSQENSQATLNFHHRISINATKG